MIQRSFFACLFLCMCSSGSSLRCRWINHKFRQHSEETLNLLDMMVSITSTAEDAEIEDTVHFPNHLYHQASTATAEEKLAFTAQILEEVAALFEEDHSSASWEESTVRNFLNIMNKQAEELRSCTEMYFKRLSDHVLKRQGHSAEAWELIRRAARDHLMRTEHLTSSLRPAH
uniref:Interferon a3-like n=1 Tax=Amphilophus citrinellus TaxID=61819 RepID=A0A3Q0TBK7_AMPCI